MRCETEVVPGALFSTDRQLRNREAVLNHMSDGCNCAYQPVPQIAPVVENVGAERSAGLHVFRACAFHTHAL